MARMVSCGRPRSCVQIVREYCVRLLRGSSGSALGASHAASAHIAAMRFLTDFSIGPGRQMGVEGHTSDLSDGLCHPARGCARSLRDAVYPRGLPSAHVGALAKAWATGRGATSEIAPRTRWPRCAANLYWRLAAILRRRI